ncbi:MAG: glycosyltransferase family 2 protein [Gemmatimonadaceae bacterium]
MTSTGVTPTLSLIVPIYNEEAMIDELRARLLPVLEPIGSFEVILINDGSKDRSADMLDALSAADDRFIAVHFSRNFGHQAAVTAGLHESKGECAVIIDADLQDPPEMINEMMAKWRQGFDVVYAQRRERAGESRMKKGTAFLYYRTLRALTEVEVPQDSGDFCLLDRKVIDVLNSMPERNRYVRGLRAWVGFRQTSVQFDRAERFAGETKYPFRKMIKLAFDGIFSLSKAPLRLSIYFGILCAALSFLLGIFFIVERLTGHPGLVRGWASLMVVVLFLGGIQLICLGAIGEYIGRTYDEAKQRPFYIIARKSSRR